MQLGPWEEQNSKEAEGREYLSMVQVLKSSKMNDFGCIELTMNAFSKSVPLPFWKDSNLSGWVVGENTPLTAPMEEAQQRTMVAKFSSH